VLDEACRLRDTYRPHTITLPPFFIIGDVAAMGEKQNEQNREEINLQHFIEEAKKLLLSKPSRKFLVVTSESA
jgi:hypothetical protein